MSVYLTACGTCLSCWCLVGHFQWPRHRTSLKFEGTASFLNSVQSGDPVTRVFRCFLMFLAKLARKCRSVAHLRPGTYESTKCFAFTMYCTVISQRWSPERSRKRFLFVQLMLLEAFYKRISGFFTIEQTSRMHAWMTWLKWMPWMTWNGRWISRIWMESF